MNRMTAVVVLAALILLGWWGFRTLFPNDEARIRKLLQGAAETASFQADTGTLNRLASVSQLCDLFTDDLEIRLDIQDFRGGRIQGKDELREVAAAAHANLRSLTLEFIELQVRVESGGTATAQVIVEAVRDGSEDLFIQEFLIRLLHTPGGWRIHHVEPVASL